MCLCPVGCSQRIPSDIGERKSAFQKTGPASIPSFCRLHFDISVLLRKQVTDGLQSVTLKVDYIQLLRFMFICRSSFTSSCPTFLAASYKGIVRMALESKK